jgi:outer membrane protein TolC
LVQLSAKTTLEYPNGPVLENINQNTFTALLTMPIFEGSRTLHQADQKLKEAQASRFQSEQLKVDLNRDFKKAQDLLQSLKDQQKLAAQDVLKSDEVAKLFYKSYKAGQINLTDVQSANVRALISRVNAARIDAQILNQLITLKALSGKDADHGR